MAEVKPSTSRGKDTVELAGEASCSRADGSTCSGSVPPAVLAAESPTFLTWIWIQIWTACSGVWGARGGGLSRPRMLGLASGAQQTQEPSESEGLSRMAASKSTWSELPGRDVQHSVSASRPNQLSVWEELKASGPHFSRDDWVETLELGRLIGEGAQAQIFEAKVKGVEDVLVLKVFKLDAGFSLADLKRHWPRSMMRGGEDRSESRSMLRRSSGFVFDDVEPIYTENDEPIFDGFRCFIYGASLLKDGSFAFLMARYWGDLRSLIDLKVEDDTHPWEFDLLFRNGSERLPFSFGGSIQIMSCVARGMQGLHAEGVLHRDLKAANILTGFGRVLNPSFHHVFGDVADYECAMFVQGTGFWRAPEVLQELQKNEEDRNGEIWTEKVDVYSFGMTCYEILTGQIPFDGYTKSKWGDVIRGERPFLPDYVFPKLRELVEACWHAQPSHRPSFQVIVEELNSLWMEERTWN